MREKVRWLEERETHEVGKDMNWSHMNQSRSYWFFPDGRQSPIALHKGLIGPSNSTRVRGKEGLVTAPPIKAERTLMH